MRPAKTPTPLPVVYYAALRTPVGALGLFGTERGLLAIALPNEPREAAAARVRRLLGGATIVEDEAAHAGALAQLSGYFAGTRQAFDVPLAPVGTPFQRAVWDAVAAIPYGETRTYLAIARQIGRPAATRAVGAANGANPLPPIVPCHRVIGADGKLHGYGGGLAIKEALLALERGDEATVECSATGSV